ncbi:hypothetical protein ABTN37_18750, partial [Acinetobacter baumannii]
RARAPDQGLGQRSDHRARELREHGAAGDGQDPAQARGGGEHGRDAGRRQGHAGQLRGPQRQEDGAGVLAAEHGALQGSPVAGREDA